MKVSVKQVYTSVACNRVPEIVDWNCEGIICYGASNAVAIYDTNAKGKDPITILAHHKSQVNSVKWLRKPDGSCTELVSCSADKTAAIWTLEGKRWRVSSELKGHMNAVTCISGVYLDSEDLQVFTGGIDSTVIVWERKNGVTSLKQTLNLNSGLCLTLHAHLLPTVNRPVLLCALDDYKIHVFAGTEYHRVHTLVGHEDWVRGLDVLNVDESTMLVASASQDTYIRLWRIHTYVEESVTGIRVEEKVFPAHGQQWAVKLDAVLAGHEGWVYGVQWHPCHRDKNTQKPVYRLLSSSLDKTLIIWEPEGEGAWVEKVRVGEVGGNGLGFYGSRFGPDGTAFMGHGYNGSFHIWRLDKESGQWVQCAGAGGHFAAVEDVRWERDGRYLLSVSADQTTRLHAPWRNAHGYEWRELSRPQVHGYDLSAVSLLSPDSFASAAEEKVVRVFRAPHNFLNNFRNITGEQLDVSGDRGPEGASVPSLGLSNKAVFADERPGTDDGDGYFVPLHMTEPPTEETLVQNTLWPEIQKLYGHGYEVFALDASPDGAVLASACKATTAEHAAVLIWETQSWQQVQKLVYHTLTVTQLSFSPDSRQLLAVSRDRRWSLYRRGDSGALHAVAGTDRTNGVHTRIVWCCAWTHDSAAFATGSRDGKICVWSETDVVTQTSLGAHALLGKPLELPNMSVTALSFAPLLVEGARLLAGGFESGVVRLYRVHVDGWSLIHELDNNLSHHLTVKRLSFCGRASAAPGEAQLASAGADHLVRIHNVTLHER